MILRGVGRRTLFDGDTDARLFLSLVVRAAHRGEIKILAFVFMPNHVHLFIESPRGVLSDAMRDIESVYARRFNRRRERTGHLVQARFRSKLVASRRYLDALVAYIDENPVDAGLVARAVDYPFGSARLYARQSGPLWLDRGPLEAFVCSQLGIATYSPEAYARVFGGRSTPGSRRWFATAMTSSAPDDLSLDALLAGSPAYLRNWMDERARSADGTARSVPVTDTESIAEAVNAARIACPGRMIRLRRKPRPFWTLVEVGLQRDLSRLSYVQIGVRLSIPSQTVMALHEEHRLATRDHSDYRDATTGCARAAIDACHANRISVVGV